MTGKEKFDKVMREFSKGDLHSGNGDLVTEEKQALAIAYSEAGKVDPDFGNPVTLGQVSTAYDEIEKHTDKLSDEEIIDGIAFRLVINKDLANQIFFKYKMGLSAKEAWEEIEIEAHSESTKEIKDFKFEDTSDEDIADIILSFAKDNYEEMGRAWNEENFAEDLVEGQGVDKETAKRAATLAIKKYTETNGVVVDEDRLSYNRTKAKEFTEELKGKTMHFGNSSFIIDEVHALPNDLYSIGGYEFTIDEIGGIIKGHKFDENDSIGEVVYVHELVKEDNLSDKIKEHQDSDKSIIIEALDRYTKYWEGFDEKYWADRTRDLMVKIKDGKHVALNDKGECVYQKDNPGNSNDIELETIQFNEKAKEYQKELKQWDKLNEKKKELAIKEDYESAGDVAKEQRLIKEYIGDDFDSIISSWYTLEFNK